MPTASKKNTSDLRKKPWNRVNLPVYSISSNDGKEENMHIITYATAISMQPKRFVCGVYHGTKTLELVEKKGSFVLQILAKNQARLVTLLGKQSGKKINKIERLKKRKLVEEWNGFTVLGDALAVMLLKVVNTMEGGDHRIFLCDVVAYRNQHNGSALTTEDLRKANIIRA